ncbi:hypothetical protein [Kribbella sp. NPDC006257]|uniref:hypothetical protein n=1 Tax=Kribbella sp. NPDC006257 TaxID=3156738 RepID=UPI0033ADEFD1
MSFLAEVIPPPGFFDDDLAELGFVMNASRLWTYRPQWQEQIFDVLGSIVREHGLTVRQRCILVAPQPSATPAAPLPGAPNWPEPPTRTWPPPSSTATTTP